ncbi:MULTISPECIES: MBL fold metallo-hydrolase [Peribacillus]|jgi:ribonuclease BN (tRNA processing enzyme)|uniref:MBL fold metallo-hydrolase n=1 Tax=Peribacillus TaxID=2675229 RepID=UPI0007BFC1D6|nr:MULTISPECIES: MBL fold metallo-hydrolase [Peribacillus]MDP9742427.1 ribonuclease BN (tRNA processing enzyme) [Bacillus sp. B2I3]MCZ0872042.1 MBL fold metallo-hydrolase [Peribacillus sp. AS_2]ULM98288.1 MBL fold metallo-hydrolase [Peribacillus frigoritolerans]WHX68136.1 MBL fold metallo-hydrolase [Peribacillus frigoritolerans]CAH0209270.1 Ribonuclease Z [Peribacillus frigoritolerans]
MKITVIGCWGGYPAKNEASSGYLLEYEDFRILLDCGSGVLSQLQNHMKPEDLGAVVLSHYHPDHVADIGVLQHAAFIQQILGSEKRTIPIYGHDLDEVEFGKLTYKDVTKGIAISADHALTIGPCKFTFMKTKHPVPCFAMRIEAENHSIVYTGDSSYMDELADFAKDANVLLCESNFYSDMDGSKAGHMTAREAGLLAEKADVQLLLLTHLPHYGNLDQLKKEASEVFKREIAVAKTNLEFQL